jgi:hypothetical protein
MQWCGVGLRLFDESKFESGPKEQVFSYQISKCYIFLLSLGEASNLIQHSPVIEHENL